MAKYTRTYIREVEAFQLNGDGPSPTPDWFNASFIYEQRTDGLLLELPGQEFVLVKWGDYIVKREDDGLDDYIDIVNAKTFETTYKIVV